ncbi:MAG TPA: hypothetical protein VGJ66_26385 [Pyrinomonadaceae bacterium]|jgi:hypothetical protein
MEIKNLVAKRAVKGVAERFLWHVGSAVVVGILAAVLWGLSGLPAPNPARAVVGAKVLDDCAAKRILGC